MLVYSIVLSSFILGLLYFLLFEVEDSSTAVVLIFLLLIVFGDGTEYFDVCNKSSSGGCRTNNIRHSQIAADYESGEQTDTAEQFMTEYSKEIFKHQSMEINSHYRYRKLKDHIQKNKC